MKRGIQTEEQNMQNCHVEQELEVVDCPPQPTLSSSLPCSVPPKVGLFVSVRSFALWILLIFSQCIRNLFSFSLPARPWLVITVITSLGAQLLLGSLIPQLQLKPYQGPVIIPSSGTSGTCFLGKSSEMLHHPLLVSLSPAYNFANNPS